MSKGALLIRGGRVISPASGLDRSADVLVEDGLIAKIGSRMRAEGREVIDASGAWVLPGLIDLHTHLREPGYEYKETILTGTRAAVAGGFTAVACMPNTDPVNDNPSVTRGILKKAAAAGLARVYPVGCISHGQAGESLAEIGALVDAGCLAVSDDGRPVASAGLMRRAMEYCRPLEIPLIAHCEEPTLAAGGVMHEGEISTRLGFAPIPAAAEEIMVSRDIILSRVTGARVHLAHVSTLGSVELIRRAKEEGLPVTAEVCPHHLLLTDEAVMNFDTSTKVNPPLRSQEDVEALRDALRDGVIDAVATDHAPHSLVEKEVDYNEAAFGITGLETALPLVLRLVDEGRISLERLVDAFSRRPAAILGVPGGEIAEGLPADLTVVDPGSAYTIDPAAFFSKGRNTPFAGWEVRGKVVVTMVAGRIVFRDGSPVEAAD